MQREDHKLFNTVYLKDLKRAGLQRGIGYFLEYWEGMKRMSVVDDGNGHGDC
jgi:hypothetical protein